MKEWKRNTTEKKYKKYTKQKNLTEINLFQGEWDNSDAVY